MGETTGGVGGRARANKIDQYVTDAVTGTVPRTTTVDGPSPKAKIPYVPSASERAAKSYGAPVSDPIVNKVDRQSSQRSNKY